MLNLAHVFITGDRVGYYDYDGDLWGDDPAGVDAAEEQIRAEVSRQLGFEVTITCIADGNGHMTWTWTRKDVP